MFRQLPNIQNRANCVPYNQKRGFTLIETMLALVLLMVVVMIISIGFMSAMQYSGDTRNYQIIANNNDNTANILFAITPAITGTGQITFHYVSGYAGATLAPMSVYPYSLHATVSPDDPNSKNRHVFIYVSPSPSPAP